MKTEVCELCRKLFVYSGYGDKVCGHCRELDDKRFKRVKEYIREHETATVMEVVVNLNVKERDVIRYLREGRLEIPENSPIFIKCVVCRSEIRSGKYCVDCAKKLKSVLMTYNLIGDKPKKIKERMRYLNTQKSQKNLLSNKS